MNLRSFCAFFRRRALDREMDDELRFHVEEQTRRNLAADMSTDEAARTARRQFGWRERIREEGREARGWSWFDNLWRDSQYALRGLRKNPTFTATAVLTLGLGLGVNTAFFTWFNAAAFRPLPVHEPEQLLKLSAVSYPDYADYRERNTVFSELLAWTGFTNATIISHPTDDVATVQDPQALNLHLVSSNYFPVLGGRMVLGRSLIPEDDASASGAPVIVLSHRFWQQRFGGDSAVIGTTIRLSRLPNELVTVVGVAAPEFIGTTPSIPDGWMPAHVLGTHRWITDRDDGRYTMIGRLRPGISREQAQSEIQVIAHQITTEFPSPVSTWRERVALQSAATYVTLSSNTVKFMSPLIAAFGVILLIACANVSNLVLARTVTRQAELGLRLALGATKRRLLAQLLTENLALGVLGGLAGWIVADGVLHVLYPLLLSFPGLARGLGGLNLEPDLRVFFFSLAGAMLAGIVGGFLPAWRLLRRDVLSAMKNEGSPFGRRLRPSRVRSVLVVAQLAFGSALLFNAGLLVHRALRVQFVDPGFDRAGLITVEPISPQGTNAAQMRAARLQLLERLRAMPGVESASETRRLPFSIVGATQVHMPGRGADETIAFDAGVREAGPGYFETLRLPILRGRPFTADDVVPSTVAIVSESAARKFWRGEDAIGQRLEVPSILVAGSSTEATTARASLTVIGVARDTRMADLQDGDGPLVYLPAAPGSSPYLIMRTSQPATAFVPALRQLAGEITGVTPYVRTVDDLFANSNTQQRVFAWVASGLAALALALAVLGLYGMMSFTVTQRVREIGVRLALGASPARIANGVLGQSLCLVVLGGGLGFALGAAFARVAGRLLLDIPAFDPVAYVAIAILLAAFGLLASWLPARRAAQVDPVIALRAE